MNYLVPEHILEDIANTARAITGRSTFLDLEEIAPLLFENFVTTTGTDAASFSTLKKIYVIPFDVKYVKPSGEIIIAENLTSGTFNFKQGTKFCIKNFHGLYKKSGVNFQQVEPDEGYDFAFTGSVTGEINLAAWSGIDDNNMVWKEY